MDREAWRATVHVNAQSWTRLKQLSSLMKSIKLTSGSKLGKWLKADMI